MWLCKLKLNSIYVYDYVCIYIRVSLYTFIYISV